MRLGTGSEPFPDGPPRNRFKSADKFRKPRSGPTHSPVFAPASETKQIRGLNGSHLVLTR